MTGYERRLRDIERELEEMEKNPKNATVADYAKLASERSAILYKIETQENLNGHSQYVREKREALSRVINEIHNVHY
jgi:hypothetical protein